MPNTDITAIVQDFAAKLVELTEASAAERVQTALASAFGMPPKRGPGRPSRQAIAAAKPTGGRKPVTVTPKVARARKLQGQYLGALRGLNQANRARVKAVAKSKGVPEALKLAASLKK